MKGRDVEKFLSKFIRSFCVNPNRICIPYAGVINSDTPTTTRHSSVGGLGTIREPINTFRGIRQTCNDEMVGLMMTKTPEIVVFHQQLRRLKQHPPILDRFVLPPAAALKPVGNILLGEEGRNRTGKAQQFKFLKHPNQCYAALIGILVVVESESNSEVIK